MESDLVTNLQQIVQERETQLKALQDRFDELKTESNEYERELENDNAYKDKEIAALRTKVEASSKKLDEYRKEVGYLNTLLDNEKAKSEQLDQTSKASERKIVDLEQDNANLENEVRNLIFERDTLHLRVEKLEEIYIIEKEDLFEQFDRKVDTLERLRQEVIEYQDEIAVLNKYKSQASSPIRDQEEAVFISQQESQISEQIRQLEETLVQYKEEAIRLTEALECRDNVIKEYESQVEKMHEELESMAECLRQKELEEFDEENELERTKHEIQNLRETLEETDKQIQELNNKLNVSHDWSRDHTENNMEKLDTYTSTKDLEVLKKTLKEMGTEIGMLSEKIKHEKETNLKLQRENEKNVKETKLKEKKLTAQKAEIGELKSSLMSERSKNSDLEKKMTKLTREIDDKNKKIVKPVPQKDTAKRTAENERRLSKTPEKQGRDSRASLLSTEDANVSLTVERLETENCLLSERLNKMLKDVEVLSGRMGTLQEEKTKLEGDVIERENVIKDLQEKYEENNDLIVFVQSLEHENHGLSDKLQKMMGDVELLAERMTTMQADKQRLEEEVTQRDSIIDELAQKLQENGDLVHVVHDLEDQNGQLNDKLEKMAEDVHMLSNKFIVLHAEKSKLEVDAVQREMTIDGLLDRYRELEKSLQTYRSGEDVVQDPVSPLQDQFKVKAYIREKEDSQRNTPVETDDTLGNMKTMTSIEEPYFTNRGAKSFVGNKSKLNKQLTNSFGPNEIEEYNSLKTDATINNISSPDHQAATTVSSKYLYAKGVKATQSSYIKLENECVYISENSSRGVRSTSKYHAKGERAVGFDKVIQKTSDLDLKMFNMSEDNILGKNLFFLIYGTKKTEKKGLKHKLVYEVIEAFKSISQKNPDKLCRLVIRVQDDKFLKKLEAARNFTALELFKQHQEFTIGQDNKEKSIDEFISQMKQFDMQLQLSTRSSAQMEKTAPKEVYMEFMMQNKSEKRGNVSEDRLRSQPVRTKIMITTTSNVKDEKELEEIHSIDSLVDSILIGNNNSQHDEFNETQRRRLPNSIEKFVILSIAPPMQSHKNVMNTLSLASKLNSLGNVQKMSKKIVERRTSHSISSPTFDKTLEGFESRVTPTKREKLSNLSTIQNLETPKGNKKAAFFHGTAAVKTPVSKLTESKEQPIQHQQSQLRKLEPCPTNRRLLKSESFTKREYEKAIRTTEPDEFSHTVP